MKWQCTVPGRPTQKGNRKVAVRTRDGRMFIKGGESAMKAEDSARSIIWAERPSAPFEGPLICNVIFYFSIPKDSREKVLKTKTIPAKLKENDPCLRKVDRGNLLKLIEDAMNGIVYEDDSQIVGGDVSKRWGERDCTVIEVQQL